LKNSDEAKFVKFRTERDRSLPMPALMLSAGRRPAARFTCRAARSLKIAPISAPVHSDEEIEAAITALGREPGGGLVVMPDVFTFAHRAPIILAAARNKVPAVYTLSELARDGGLLSYGEDLVDSLRRAATYVDRVLRGEKPGDLPVQFPTKFETVVNRKTATALGLAIPPSILLRADEMIE
jgi:putative ABC transport system substrate-binding protein